MKIIGGKQMCCENCGKNGQDNLLCGKYSNIIDKIVEKNSKVSFMKKAIISVILLLGILMTFIWYYSSNSFEFKIEDIKFAHGEGTVVIGKVKKGTLNAGDTVKIKRDGEIIKSVTVHIIVKVDEGKMKAIKSISQEDNIEDVSIGLEDINEKEISINDIIVK